MLNKETTKNLKLDITVIRINRNGDPCNARPCYNCLNMMKSVGIRRVYYSISPLELVCENVKDMISIQASHVTKYIEKLNNNNDNNEKFYENLLKKNFPNIVKRHNLNSFIQHNLNNVLPTYKVEITKQMVLIMNSNGLVIIKASVIT